MFPTTHAALARALAAREYTTPTAVQLAVLAEDASNRDLLVSAQTGSGKTVAFGLALAATLLGEADRFEAAVTPLALIVAPTRELALQVQRELDWLYAETGARVITCVGGMDVQAEARQLRGGAHIVVGTPGRLRDHLERRRLDLTGLKAVVLDEADEMLDLGFREDLEFILDASPETRRTLMFSATMPSDIETLARRYQREALRIATVRRDEQHADIDYQAIRVAPGDVEHAVVNVLRFHEARASIVFCATREAVKRMHASLIERGFAAVALSGELTQAERTTALQALRDGRARVLVATDVAARGLDLPDLSLVIHAALPNDAETLLHRSGRTGRAGRKGLCVLIIPFNRRRQGDTLLAGARVKASWAPAPSAEEIRARDQERFLADAIFAGTATEEEQAALVTLQAARSAEQIGLALLRMQAARLPAPEDIAKDAGPPPRGDRLPFAERVGQARSWDKPREGGDRGGFTRRPRREDNRDMVWFRLNIGRDKNADPRWLLPLICNAGGVTKAEIGSIRIQDRDTRFQIVADAADAFADAARTSKNKEGQISRVGADEAATPQVDAAPALAPREPAEAASSGTGDRSPARDAGRPDGKPAWRNENGRNDKKKPFKAGSHGASADRPRSFERPAAGDGGKPAWRDDKKKPFRPNANRSNGAEAAPRHAEAHPTANTTPPGDAGKPAWRDHQKKPFRHGDDRPAGGEGSKPAWRDHKKKPFEAGRDRPTDTTSGAGKPAWRERTSKPFGKPTGQGGKPRPGKPHGFGHKGGQSDGPSGQAPRSAQRFHGTNAPKPTSKYAHKKKQRPPVTAS